MRSSPSWKAIWVAEAERARRVGMMQSWFYGCPIKGIMSLGGGADAKEQDIHFPVQVRSGRPAAHEAIDCLRICISSVGSRS